MTDDNGLDPIERLRAADPAADLEPRAGFADDVVASATAESQPGQAPVADLAGERARRRTRWIGIAAVAASLVIVGGAGYGVGAWTGGSTDPSDSAAAPPVSLQSGVDGGVTEQAGPPVTPGSGQVEFGRATPDIGMPYGFGRNSFTASGLSTDAGTAEGYAFDPRASSAVETVASLAEEFGVTGTPELTYGAWHVGPKDGSGASFSVSLDGTLSFSYSNPPLSPWNCVKVDEPCGPTGAVPSEDAALDAISSVISMTGRDPDAFELTSEAYEGSPTRTAQAWPVIDSQRIELGWHIEVAEGGILYATGFLAPIVDLGEYPIVSEQEAFERLSDPRFGAQMTAFPYAVGVGATDASEPTEWVPPTEPPATPREGTALAWAVNDVEIVEARLGLATNWQPDGSVLVVPAYEFTDTEGGTWSVIAVAESKLDFSAE